MYKNLKHDRPHRFWCLQKTLMMCSLYNVNVCTMYMYLITINNMRNANNCIKHNNIIFLTEKLTNSEIYVIDFNGMLYVFFFIHLLSSCNILIIIIHNYIRLIA